MNIFILDKDIEKNASYYPNSHVVKMITEFNQILSSAHYFTDDIPKNIYKLTHKNHPASLWARESLSNWLWLKEMNKALSKEYTYRYNRIHKGEIYLESLPVPNIKDIGLTPFKEIMPENILPVA